MANIKNVGIVDEPVAPGSSDSLDISIHAKALIQFITISQTPITVGIQGEWGSGKTSLINNIYHHFDKQNNIKQIWINSWEFSLLASPEESLLKIISAIIDELLEADKNTTRRDKIQKGAKKIFSGALRIGAHAALGKEAATVASELVSSGSSTIASLRKQLTELVVEIQNRASNPYQKVIIYVDDLDRIEPKNAVAILELLKNIFNVPNCVFVLAIDYQVVVKGLEEKFGKQTAENEWEFRAFFDKIIQLPFMMPMGQYNIGKYVNNLLKETGFIDEEELDEDYIRQIISYTIGGNPRSIKRLVNSISLIKIFSNIKLEEENDTDEETTSNDSSQEKILLFSILCLQIAYPNIYSLLINEPDFTKWDNNFAFKITKGDEDKDTSFAKEFDVAKKTEDFNEEWEQAIFKICFINKRVFPKVFQISSFFSLIKDDIMSENKELIGETLAKILTQTSVTSVESTDKGQNSSPLKAQTRAPLSAIESVYKELMGMQINNDFLLRVYEGDWIAYKHKYNKRGITSIDYQIVAREKDVIEGGAASTASRKNSKILIIMLIGNKKWINDPNRINHVCEEINKNSKINNSKYKIGKWYGRDRIFINIDINDHENAANSFVELMEISFPIIEKER